VRKERANHQLGHSAYDNFAQGSGDAEQMATSVAINARLTQTAAITHTFSIKRNLYIFCGSLPDTMAP